MLSDNVKRETLLLSKQAEIVETIQSVWMYMEITEHAWDAVTYSEPNFILLSVCQGTGSVEQSWMNEWTNDCIVPV